MRLLAHFQSPFYERFLLWRTLLHISLLILFFVVSSIAVDAYSLNKTFVWVSERVLDLNWEPPVQEVDHYRVEVVETDLLREPVTSIQYFRYVKDNEYRQELKQDYSYLFRIQGVTPHGTFSMYSDPSLYIVKGGEAPSNVSDAQPVAFELSQNYPNPFNSHTTIQYQVPGSGSSVEVGIVVYNILGQQVRRLVVDQLPPDKYSVVWDGCDDSGRPVSSGHYIYQLTAGKHQMSKRMMFMK